ncbi:MAG: division/cell wall cluster transcriptional repressor MraZ [Pirellulales bacterium]|nr:division/cell wall cluster transcriptional repressor MraZ [Pirellulales bacterium]
MALTGTFSRSLDEKLRVAIPKPLRDGVKCQPGGALYIAPGTDGSLALYTEDSFSRLARRLRRGSPTQQQVRAFARLFFARAQRVELDAQGRVRIAAELAALAGLDREVVLLGVEDHVELWAAARWRDYLAQRQAHYDELAEAAFGKLG